MGRSGQPKSCCGPKRSAGAKDGSRSVRKKGDRHYPLASIEIPGGKAHVGTNTPILADDGEGPLRLKTVRPFRIMQTAVTNAAFAEFVDETGFVSEAERFGWSFVFFSDVPKSIAKTQAVQGSEWWRKVDGATWRDIHGPGTFKAAKSDHPVVHVSWNDAKAYAAWCGGRLPSEAEWEHAARGGLGDVRFPWGDREPNDTSFQPCNIWQGQFPNRNTAADGWAGTAPVDAYSTNGFGLYNMVGNVWEWTAEPYRVKSLKKSVKRRLDEMKGFKLLKGGSFLCHHSYCYRYRIAARIGNAPDTSTPHQGFRVVWDV